jgi:hypothetical protein
MKNKRTLRWGVRIKLHLPTPHQCPTQIDLQLLLRFFLKTPEIDKTHTPQSQQITVIIALVHLLPHFLPLVQLRMIMLAALHQLDQPSQAQLYRLRGIWTKKRLQLY